MASRGELLERLQTAGWDGPTSYGKERLEELTVLVEKKGVDAAKSTLPRRGRPAVAAD